MVHIVLRCSIQIAIKQSRRSTVFSEKHIYERSVRQQNNTAQHNTTKHNKAHLLIASQSLMRKLLGEADLLCCIEGNIPLRRRRVCYPPYQTLRQAGP